MTTTDLSPPTPDDDLAALGVAWDIDTLLGADTVDALLDRADAQVAGLEQWRGRLAGVDAGGLEQLMGQLADLEDTLGRVGSYVGLRLAVDTLDPER